MRFLIIILFTSCFFSIYAQQNFSWVKNSELCQAVQVAKAINDNNGNSYVTAAYYSSVAIGGVLFNAVQGTDAFVIKLNQYGTITWSLSFAGPGNNYFTDLALDSQNNLYACGIYFNSPINLDTFALEPANTSINYFLCKISSAGQVLWVKSNRCGVTKALIASTKDGIVLGGQFSGTLAAGSSTLVSNGGKDYFISKFDQSGNHLWSISNGGADDENVTGISVLSTGEPVVAANSTSSVISYPSYTVGGSSTFGYGVTLLAKYNSSGVFMWAQSIPSFTTYLGSISPDSNGNFYYGSSFLGQQAVMGSFTLAGGNGYHAAIAKFGNLGNVLWAKSIQSPGNTYITDICTDLNGNALFCGNYEGAYVSIGTNTLTNDSTRTNMFLATCDPMGFFLNSTSMGGKYDDQITSVSISGSGDILIAGSTNGPRTVIGTSTINPTSTGSEFCFIASTVSPYTGFTELLKSANTFSVFPNPFTDEFFLNSDDSVARQISLYDVEGRLVKCAVDQVPGGLKISLLDEAPGIYLLLWNGNNGTISRKVIKE